MTLPEPDASHLSPPALIAALRGMEPRPSALLLRRLVEGLPQEACAAFYGVSTEAFSLLLLRASLALAGRVGLSVREPASEAEEAAWARMLTDALAREDARLPTGLVPVAEVCRRLRAVGADVAAGMDTAARDEAASPHRRREDWLRRLAVAALLALTAYLYLSRPDEPPRRPRPPIPATPPGQR